MVNYIIRRFLLMFPTLIGVTAVVFFIMGMSPGGVGGPQMDELGQLDAEQARVLVEYYEERYGLGDPLPVQYGRWLNNVSPVGVWADEPGELTGRGITLGQNGEGELRRVGLKVPDLGRSYSRGRPVLDMFVDALPITILLNLLSIPIVYLIAIVVGIYAGRHRGKMFDVSSSVAMLVLWAIPPIWAGVMLIGYLASEQYVRWFPASGISSTRAEDMAFLPTTEAFWQSVGFGLYVVVTSVAVVTAALAAIALFVAGALAPLARRGGTDPAGPLKFGLWSVAVCVPLFGVFLLFQTVEALPTQMAGFERGWLFDRLYHLALPVVCLAYGGFAFLSKLMRSAMLENLSADFVRTARAKGVAENVVLWQHVFRNSLLPLITVAAVVLPGLLTGSVIIENIFSIPGMGLLMIEAIFERDREVVLAAALIGGLLGLTALIIADIGYAIADPRVSYE